MPKPNKMHVVMGEFKRGTLHSGSGQIVKKRKQAVAIGLSEAGLSRQRSERIMERYAAKRLQQKHK